MKKYKTFTLKRKLILSSQSRRNTAFESVNYAECKAIFRRLCDLKLQLLFQIISYNFFKQIIMIFAFFYKKDIKK